jgi:pyrroline-5-carboxylate reductase
MPNTAALVQSAASVFCPGSFAQAGDCQLVNKLFSSVGYCAQLDEKHLDAVTALSGSGPAYVFMMIEALADGGVKMGLPRDVAQKLAAQTVLGSGKMVLETGKHPGELKDMVCSPGGTTIEAVHHLEKCGVRAALIGAVEVAALKSSSLGSHN